MTAQREELRREAKPGIRLTAFGRIFLFLLIWIPLAAVVTGNNFLFIIFGMMVGLALVSHSLAGKNIDSIRISRRFPEEIFARTPFTIVYLIRTDRKRWGSSALKFEEPAPLEGSGESPAFAHVAARNSARGWGLFSLESRGDHSIRSGVISSSFPFGLATYSRRCGRTDRVLVYPRIEPVHTEAPLLPGWSGTMRERPDPSGIVPYLFRDYLSGDPYKNIDWKKSARTGTLVTRVLSDEGVREIVIRLPATASEEVLSKAASLVYHLGGLGTPVALQGPGLKVDAGVGRAFTGKLLSILARWENSTLETAASDHNPGMIVEIDQSGQFRWTQPGERFERAGH